jgi:hypothetical protein
LIWPTSTSFDNPIVGILASEGLRRFNFLLLNGEVTSLPCDVDLQVSMFDPDTVRKIVLWWYEDDAALYGIEMFDKSGNLILRVGLFPHWCKQ